MDHGVLVVNFAALHQAGADIQKALNTLDSQLGQLERDAAPLVAELGRARPGRRTSSGRRDGVPPHRTSRRCCATSSSR